MKTNGSDVNYFQNGRFMLEVSGAEEEDQGLQQNLAIQKALDGMRSSHQLLANSGAWPWLYQPSVYPGRYS